MIRIWIVDDLEIDMTKAKEAVERAVQRVGVLAEIKALLSFFWPALPPEALLPDIVVLDLVEDGQCKGDAFYEALRQQEQLRRCPKAFVIIWSGRWDNPAAVAFVETVKKSDPFIADLEGVKTSLRLENAVEGIIRRLEEER
jgi:hypothetical protein